MKAKKQIVDIRRQSRIAPSSENLWFFSENNSDDQFATAKKKSVKNDRTSILRNDYDRYSLDNSGRDNKKKECPFIVDWQMSDIF